MKHTITSLVVLGILALTVGTFGTINPTFDGLLEFFHGAYHSLLTVMSIVFVFCTLIFLADVDDETDEKKIAGLTSLLTDRTSVHYVMMVVIPLSFVGTYVYLEWSGFLYWYLTNYTIIRISDLLMRGKLKQLTQPEDDLGLGDNDGDHDDLSEFR